MKNKNLAKLFFNVIPNSMSLVRCHVRKASEPDLSFAKFRVLANINRGIQTVGEIAELHGVSQPAISKLVESLFTDKLVTRHDHISDRRIIELRLTPAGLAKIKCTKLAAGETFEPYLDCLLYTSPSPRD